MAVGRIEQNFARAEIQKPPDDTFISVRVFTPDKAHVEGEDDGLLATVGEVEGTDEDVVANGLAAGPPVPGPKTHHSGSGRRVHVDSRETGYHTCSFIDRTYV